MGLGKRRPALRLVFGGGQSEQPTPCYYARALKIMLRIELRWLLITV